MRIARRAAWCVLEAIVVGCGDGRLISDAPVSISVAGHDAGAQGVTTRDLGAFEGAFDPATGTLAIAPRNTAPGTVHVLDDPLPYGGSAATGATSGDVLFHTCGSATYSVSGAGGTLSATVQAVNNMTSAVQDLTVVIDAIAPADGTTFVMDPVSQDYGTVPNGNDFACDSPLATWSFIQASTTSFTFSGHATGTLSCTKVVTSSLDEANPYGQSITIGYSMVGGGGGGGGAGGGGGGGGGSSAILNGGSLAQYAAGGGGGSSSILPGSGGTTASGSFSLASSANLTVYVGGGGGGGANQGGGGGSGYFGGGGGAAPAASGVGGGGGTTVGGSAAGNAQAGSSLAGGNSGNTASHGGSGGTGGTGGSNELRGGGGGGFGGGGGADDPSGTTSPSAGGSNGASATTVGSISGGVGANTWASSTTLPAAAGAGASVGGQGGNGGLVILTYIPPDGTCSL